MGIYQAAIRKARAPLTIYISVEPVGNEYYGFDWDNRKFLVSEDHQPE
jgi:hypothetical protein